MPIVFACVNLSSIGLPLSKSTRYGNCSRLLKDLFHVCPMFFSKIRKKLTNNSNNMSKIRSGFMLISWHTINYQRLMYMAISSASFPTLRQLLELRFKWFTSEYLLVFPCPCWTCPIPSHCNSLEITTIFYSSYHKRSLFHVLAMPVPSPSQQRTYSKKKNLTSQFYLCLNQQANCRVPA